MTRRDADPVADMAPNLALILAAVWKEAPHLDVFTRNPEMVDMLAALCADLDAAEALYLEAIKETPA